MWAPSAPLHYILRSLDCRDKRKNSFIVRTLNETKIEKATNKNVKPRIQIPLTQIDVDRLQNSSFGSFRSGHQGGGGRPLIQELGMECGMAKDGLSKSGWHLRSKFVGVKGPGSS